MSVEKEIPNEDLGTPDFSSIFDDDTAEIKDHHLGQDEPKQAKQGLPVGETIAMVAGMCMSFVASRKGEHWRLSKDEAEELADASQAVADQYMPDFEMSPAWMLAGVCGAIALPRVMIDAKIKAEESAQQSADSEAKQGSADSEQRHETPEYSTTE